MNYVGFDKVEMFDKDGFAALRKSSPEVKIDFGGTGQGYGIDEVGIFLETKGIENYLVDIGGECRARGKNPNNDWWTIGINTPKSDAAVTDFTRMVKLEILSVSTSGNYRNFHEVDGKKYSHFISPISGFPEKSNLLSASCFWSGMHLSGCTGHRLYDFRDWTMLINWPASLKVLKHCLFTVMRMVTFK